MWALPIINFVATHRGWVNLAILVSFFFASTLSRLFALTLHVASSLHFDTSSPLRFNSFDTALLLHYNTVLLLRFNISSPSSLRHCVASSLDIALLLRFDIVLLLRLATLICLQLLGSLIRLSQFYFVCTQSSSSSWFFVSSLIMVVFVDSSKTPKNQFITILSHADEPIEEGITLAWWSESSRELYDPSKRDSHPCPVEDFYIAFFPPFRYPKPLNKRSLRRSVRGKLSHNPRGIITTHRNQCRTEDEEAPFRILKVSEKAKEETWLAALLSCWLGEFVFPGKEANLIRPGTFKVASSMARGKKYCLAVPVLATIYKGLNDIRVFLSPYPLDPCMVRFSGEGAAKYFEEAEARKLFCSITKFKFHRLALFKGHQEILEDNDQLSDSYVDYFISQRPSYLSSRRGDLSVLEPYSPHRFGRQFGFTQDIPGEIKEDLRHCPLRKSHASLASMPSYQHKVTVFGPFLVPSSDAAPCTKDYMDWWAKRSDGFFSSDPSQPNGNIGPRFRKALTRHPDIVSTFRGADRAMASHAKKLNEEDGISCSDHGNEVGVDSLKEVDKRQSPVDGSPSMSEFSVQGLETFDLATKVIEKPHLEKSNASIPPSGPICNPTKDMVSKVRSSGIPTASTVSTLNAEDVISKASRHYAFMLGEGLIEKIIKTPFDSVASLKEEVRKIIHAIRQTTIVDVMPLQDRVWKFMENASQYSSIRSAFTQRISLEVKNQRRADAERRYTLALESEAIEARDSSRAEAELSKVFSKETELRKELELLATQRGKLENSISLHEEKLPQLQATVSRIKEEISEIEATPTLETSDHAKLQELRELLETSREELKNLDWIGRSSFM
uniref:Aminotransferase-like plant mobile domain-containing protein n=1 Tax=Fagus sylvatica TaxID=28930 RepID=A0A2N9GIT9_FAGSY